MNRSYHHPSDLATIEMTTKSLQMGVVAPTKLIFGSQKMAERYLYQATGYVNGSSHSTTVLHLAVMLDHHPVPINIILDLGKKMRLWNRCSWRKKVSFTWPNKKCLPWWKNLQKDSYSSKSPCMYNKWSSIPWIQRPKFRCPKNSSKLPLMLQ